MECKCNVDTELAESQLKVNASCLLHTLTDDRFVLKQMSKMEIQSFLDLAPNYMAYTLQANRENRPTAFCKIVGAFRIVFKNTQTNAASKQDLLVMENLFYNRNVKRKYDLKGSQRNRLISATEAEMNNCVLLDENFMNSTIYKS